jgi:phage gpG-like protein
LGPTHIGVHKGKLASSIQMRINGHEITIGSDVDYAAEFNFKTKHSPERKFLGRDSRADRKVLEALNRFFSVSFLR